jgi:uncharacterized protein YyaL (SSP411 family)
MFGYMLIVSRVKPEHITRGKVSANMKPEINALKIAWREWSKKTFDEARASGKLVLLDLSADWCHWCHVMDLTTYSDPDVIETVNREFVPVRVDIDARPDISERYNRGGFPTTAFLSDQGESVWGATYIPPRDMKRILDGILSAKASGEIADALDRSRSKGPEQSRLTLEKASMDECVIDSILEDIFATYDVEHGGFGLYPKFPHPDVLNLLLLKHLSTNDEGMADAVHHTISSMTRGLFDEVEGGVFRYSVTRDWTEPHYEKMLETNAAFLRNLVAAYKVFHSPEYGEIAAGVVRFLLGTLRDEESGGFFGSQDADEEYYKLPEDMRSRRERPAIVRAIYGGWNSEAVSALAEAGAIFGRREWLDAASAGWEYSVSKLWDNEMCLVRHEERKDIYLLDDQVSFLDALLSVYSLSGEAHLLELGRRLVSGIERHFQHPRGGYADILCDKDAIGELGERRRSLVTNSRYARVLALFSAAAHDENLAREPERILSSFSRRDLEIHGIFAAEFLIAWHVLREGARVVTIFSAGGADVMSSDLWLSAKAVYNPAVICSPSPDPHPGQEEATICMATGCSGMVSDPEELTRRIAIARRSQA